MTTATAPRTLELAQAEKAYQQALAAFSRTRTDQQVRERGRALDERGDELRRMTAAVRRVKAGRA